MIAIIGAGAAGWAAARALRDYGYDGGVRVFELERAAPYERPTLSKQFLTNLGLEYPPTLATHEWDKGGIRLELSAHVISVDPGSQVIHTSTGAEVRYEYLLMATGSQCRRLQLPGADLMGVHYLRNVGDALRLRAELLPDRRIAIIGGGVIGLEVAGSAVARGCSVTVIEAAPHVMGRVVPAEMAAAIEDVHSARGVTLRTATRPITFDVDGGRIRGVALDTGEVIPADAVVAGVGASPSTALASAAGLDVDDDGVLVDDHFRSSDDRVFAAGDVANVFHLNEGRHLRVEQWRGALDQGAQAAANMLSIGKPYRGIPWMWSDQHDVHLQATGFGFDRATEIIRRGALTQPSGLAYLGVRDDRLVAACGISTGPAIGKTIRIAQLLIERGSPVDLDRLADSGQSLKPLIAQAPLRTT